MLSLHLDCHTKGIAHYSMSTDTSPVLPDCKYFVVLALDHLPVVLFGVWSLIVRMRGSWLLFSSAYGPSYCLNGR